MIEPLPPGSFDRVEYLNEFPFPKRRLSGEPRGFWNLAGFSLRSLGFLLEFSRAFFISAQFLSKHQPNLCVGFGSYVSYPGMKLANWKKIPTLIHEQNTIPGKATQWLASQMDRVAVSFPETKLPAGRAPLEITGLPVRRLLFEEAQKLQRVFKPVSEENPLRILVVGGSQGAQALNLNIFNAFLRLSPEERKKLAVTHITGKLEFDSVTSRYEKLNMKFKTFAFSNQMHALYSQSDFAITRAGANTLFELALFGLPAIAVPFPHAAENHQELNARYFESQAGLGVQNENALTPEWLQEQMRRFENPGFREEKSRRLKALAPSNAADRLTELAWALLN